GGCLMRSQTYVILTIVFVIIVSIFAVTNVEPVEVNYLFWKGKSPLILVILFSVLMGGVITAAAGSVKFFRLQRMNKQLNYKNQHMRKILIDHNLLEDEELKNGHSEPDDSQKK